MYIPSETGYWINEDFARLSEVLHDYDPYLELRWIPHDKRTVPEDHNRAYCIVDTRSNHIIRYCSDNDSVDDVLASVFIADNRHGNVLDRMDDKNRAIKVMRLKKQLDEADEIKDQAAFLMRTRKNYIKFNGKKLDDQLRRLE